MSELMIFAGTTEGRKLAETCARQGIPADVSVVSRTGADLIASHAGLRIRVGALDEAQMAGLFQKETYGLVIDATHPYAKEATRNIRRACEQTGTAYLRVRRETVPAFGPAFDSMEDMIVFLNERIAAGEDPVILSGLGGKSMKALTAITDYERRLWLRVLPADGILEQAVSYGYPAEHVIQEQGPFSAARNAAHIRMSGASCFLTKESGEAGGYPQKVQAARECGITLLTLKREPEEGVSLTEAVRMILELRKRG